jgi:RNA polymerase sigma-70 factor (ECF subfamily)
MNTELSDEQIAATVQAGQVEDFGFLIERYDAKLKRYAKRFLSRPEDVEDLVQDVFIKSYTNLQSFDVSQRFSPWIYRIAHNVFVNELRRKERRGLGIFDADVLLPQIPARETADADHLSEELKNEMEQLLDTLPIKYREVLILFYYEELSYAEISDILRIPTTTIGVRLKRARTKLQTAYEALETNI